jgi:hypothetical protein
MAKEMTTPKSINLAPYQKNFVEEFINSSPDKRFYHLSWPMGSGKTITIVHAVQRFFSENPEARVIVIFEYQVLQQSLLESFLNAQVDARVVDRFEYRMMQDSVSVNESVWEQGVAYLLNRNFLIQDDVSESVRSVKWDLLVSFSADYIFSHDRKFLDRLISSSPELRVLAESDSNVHLPSIDRYSWMVARLSMDEVRKAFNYATSYHLSPNVNVLSVHQTVAEINLNATANEIIMLLRETSDDKSIVSEFSSRLASSPVAFEEEARKLRNYMAHGRPQWETSGQAPPRPLAPQSHLDVKKIDRSLLFLALAKYLRQIEELSRDSKISVLKEKLAEEFRAHTDVAYVCIYSSYVSTLRYIKASLDDEGFSSCFFPDNSSLTEHGDMVARFVKNGGVWLGSGSLLKPSLDFGSVKTLIFYDLPNESEVFFQIYGQFNRLGRKQKLNLIAFDVQGSEYERPEYVIDKLMALMQDVEYEFYL